MEYNRPGPYFDDLIHNDPHHRGVVAVYLGAEPGRVTMFTALARVMYRWRQDQPIKDKNKHSYSSLSLDPPTSFGECR